MTNAARVLAARRNFFELCVRSSALSERDARRNINARAINAISRLMPQKG